MSMMGSAFSCDITARTTRRGQRERAGARKSESGSGGWKAIAMGIGSDAMPGDGSLY